MSDTLEEFNRAYSEKEQWAREMGIYGFAEKLQRERDEARELAHRFRSLYYTQLGIESSASWFPWENVK